MSIGQKYQRGLGIGFGFGTSERGGINSKSYNELPGPGQYTIDSWNPNGIPRYGFGTSKRSEFNKTGAAPGPGQYNYSGSQFGKTGYKASMKFRPPSANMHEKAFVPGPGQYNPALTVTRSGFIGGKFGTEKRENPQMKSMAGMPGPGHFNSNDQFSRSVKGVGFGTSQRSNLNQAEKGVPGPGNYNVSSFQKGAPAYSMRGKYGLKGKEFVPGPGQYNYGGSSGWNSNGGSTKIGTSKRSNLGQANLGNPGPGNYCPSDHLNGPSFGFGSGGRYISKKDTTPGPGQYKLPYYVAELPSYTLPDRSEELRYR